MMKWFIGITSSLILGAIGWMTTFIIMGYKAQADIVSIKQEQDHQREYISELKSDIKSVQVISERTEKNTETIRDYLLKKSINNDR